MKKRKIISVLVLILVAAICIGAITAIADFGDFSGGSDYGGSDYGSSDWGSSSSSDWGSSGGGSFGGSSETMLFVLIALGLPIFLISKRSNKNHGGGSRGTGLPAGGTAIDISRLRRISEYRERDPKFSDPELHERISNLYVQMQNCWTAKNLEPLRPYFTDVAYAQFDRQLDRYRRENITNYVDRIAVLGVELRGWFEQEDNDCMVASVRTRIVDYTKDDRSGVVVSGSSTAEKFMTYEYVLIRSSGFVTGSQDRDAKTINCPNCGAPLDINRSTQCPFCNSIVTTKDYDWVISSIKGISQQTRQT